MRLAFSSSLAFLFLLLPTCGNSFESSKDAPKGGDAGAGGEGDAGAGLGGGAGAGDAGAGDAGTGGDTGGGAGASMGGTAGAGTGGTAGATGGTAGSAGAPPCRPVGTWQTIDDFQLAVGQHSNPGAIAAAPPNRLYTVGVARMGTFRWHARRSRDGGGTWEDMGDFDSFAGGASDVVVDSAGTVFVVGNADTGRIVRRSTNNGDTWMTVDTIPGGTGTDPCSSGWLALTPNNTVYVAAGCDSVGVIVRRSTNGGDTWNQVDSFKYMQPQTRMGTLGVDTSGQVYVGGVGVSPDGVTHWLIRRGTGVGTWTTVDDFLLAGGNSARVANFGGTDAVYAAGTADDADGAAHWIVRRAPLDDPSGFRTVDDVSPTQNMERLAAHNVYQTSSGEFIASGYSAVGTAPGRVIYRRSADGESWSSMGDFVYVSGQDSSPEGRLVADASGNLFGMVRGVDADGAAHWVVRKLTCN
jgi:hypothetical protein